MVTTARRQHHHHTIIIAPPSSYLAFLRQRGLSQGLEPLRRLGQSLLHDAADHLEPTVHVDACHLPTTQHTTTHHTTGKIVIYMGKENQHVIKMGIWVEWR